MNWALSISERLQTQKALKKFSISGAPWIAPVCQVAALFILIIIPFATYNWLTQNLIMTVEARPASFFSSLIGQSVSLGTGDGMLVAIGILPYAFILYALGWVYLFSSVRVTRQGRNDDTNQAFVVFCSSAAVSLASSVILSTSGRLSWLVGISMALAGGALIAFSLLYPGKERRLAQKTILLWIGLLPSIFFSLFWLSLLDRLANPELIAQIWTAELAYLVIASFTLLAILIYHQISSDSETIRKQARRVAVGLAFSTLPIIVLVLAIPGYQISAITLIPLSVFPIVTSYNLRSRQSSHKNNALQTTVTYALLSGLVVSAYFLLVSGLSLVLGERVAGDNPLLIALMVFVLAVSLNPARNLIQVKISELFQHSQVDPQPQALAVELTREFTIDAIVTKFQEVLSQFISPSLIHLYLFDQASNQYVAVPDLGGQPTSDLRFPADNPLVSFLANVKRPFEFGDKISLPDELQDEYSRMALLGADLFIALPGQKELVGWLALNLHRSPRRFRSHDIITLESLCNQAAIAIERSLVISNLERRVREMDVLTRIAQGVNITLDFDNILELIYAQANLVIPSIDFRITLRSTINRRNFHAFFLENDDRQAHNENIDIPPRNGLEEIIIHNQHALMTPDYEHECLRWGVLPNAPDIYAWMGVPLNAGSETIGAICLGSRDPSIVYSERQRDLLQAIADQAAGAIIKARLLSESERRARQLAKLNEVGRSLASTLEIKPLLTQIMNSAVELLNCEAGSLIMIDESTHELVFEVTVGPISDDLSGTRLPAGTGLVGKAAETGEPLIANHIIESQTWIDEADQQTGFLTRDFLAVPMKVKETTIGVIQIINKLDGAAFTQDDLEILSTFTSQAAVAVENARLYTHTDEALSARLEEMSAMQRIDRELNASLDVERTMRITLDWSLDYSGAEAGLIGFVASADDTPAAAIRVSAHEGFNDIGVTSSPFSNSGDPQSKIDIAEIPAMYFAVQEGQPVLSKLNRGSNYLKNGSIGGKGSLGMAGKEAFLSDKHRSQLIIPIRRKSDVIGLLVLESKRDDLFSDDAVAFLTRLSDHAAIAISNALLYADLQAANVAKSEFVSLVSHELKTPMTSIRGYTDLLAQGTVGPINEIQSNFLNTIRSNVNRMANLVSDLTDVSRIEAGRMRLEFGSIAMSKIIDEVLSSVNAQLAEKDHVLDLAISDGLPNIWGDYNRLIQVMNNLLSNAIKYTPQHGQIKVACQLTQNPHAGEEAPQLVLVSVSDSGYGIAPEDRSKIFHKFFRSSDQNIRDVPGTGLGLNITRHLVEMQGGQIWFDSIQGEGTTFNFTVPVAATD